MEAEALTVLADRGYYAGEEILACTRAGITPLVPKPLTSPAKAEGRFGKQDFSYEPEDDTYRCPAGEKLTRRFASVEKGMTIHVMSTGPPGAQAVPSRRSVRPAVSGGSGAGSMRRCWTRWRSGSGPDLMPCRFAKARLSMPSARSRAGWEPRTSLRKGLKTTAAEMALHVLAYNLKRVIGLLGVRPLLAGIRV